MTISATCRRDDDKNNDYDTQDRQYAACEDIARKISIGQSNSFGQAAFSACTGDYYNGRY